MTTRYQLQNSFMLMKLERERYPEEKLHYTYELGSYCYLEFFLNLFSKLYVYPLPKQKDKDFC